MPGANEAEHREMRWATLMRQALGGDDAAYRRLLAEVAPVLRATIARRLAAAGFPRSESEDVVQETLLAIHLKRQTWRATDPFSPWLHTVARNKLVDHMRRRGRRIEIPIADFAEILPAEVERPGADSAEVERHLASLPEKQRMILRAIAIDGSTAGEAAARYGMTPGAVRVTLHRAFAALSARLRQRDA